MGVNGNISIMGSTYRFLMFKYGMNENNIYSKKDVGM